MNDLGIFILQELENKNLNQADLSRGADTTEATISRIIRGERQPSISMCHSIAKALNVPANVVFGKAGILDPESQYSDLISNIAHKASMLSEKDQITLLKIIEVFLIQQE